VFYDRAVFEAIYSLSRQSKFLDFVGIFLANYVGYFLILAVLVLLFLKKDWRSRFFYLSLIALSVLLSRWVITEIIRFVYNRPRPFVELGFAPLISPPAGWAFPSGHAAVFFALAFAVWFIDRRWFLWFLAVTVLMGLARIFVGVHWPLDILAGALVALTSAVIIRWILPRPDKV